MRPLAALYVPPLQLSADVMPNSTSRGMADSFVVRSTVEGALVELSRVDHDRFSVRLELTGLQATIVASSYMSEGIADLFASFARDWRGWDGERGWTSCEGEVELVATADRAGHVQLIVAVRRGWEPHGWQARGVIQLEAGQLDGLARDAASFESAVLRSA